MNYINTDYFGKTALLAVGMLLSFNLVASSYIESWENGVVDNPSLKRNGACYYKPKNQYNSFELSNKFVRAGRSALRVEMRGNDKNEVCTGSFASEKKSRAEFEYAVGIPEFRNIPDGAEVWIGASLYFPSNEGTFSSWWSKSERIIILQLVGGGNSANPEMHFLLGSNGLITIEQTSSTAEVGENKVVVYDTARIKPDTWVDIVIHWRRTWQSNGFRQVWIDGVKVVDRIGPSSIRNKPFGFLKVGEYFGSEIRNETYVMYADEVKMGDKSYNFESFKGLTAGSVAATPPPPSAPVIQVN